MCLICLEFDKLTLIEATNNLGETSSEIGEEHTKKVAQDLIADVWENAGDESYINKNGGEEAISKCVKKLRLLI